MPAFLDDVIEGLSRPDKALPSKYFYDARGSALFDQITELDAYYPTRTERGILDAHADDMAAAIGPEAVILEYGSGSSTKTRLLLDALERPAGYVPIDISAEHLAAAADRLRAAYPNLDVLPVAADYSEPVPLPDLPPHRRRVLFFPGSTIGNFERDEAQAFLRRAASVLGEDGGLLLGVDRVKPTEVLLPAYDDPEGVTAAFNKNVLRRINDELGGDFDLDAFTHRAAWNADEARIEMYLVSQAAQTVRLDGRAFGFAEGETIHTEHSHKYTLESAAALAESAGFRLANHWSDDQDWFSVLWFER